MREKRLTLAAAVLGSSIVFLDATVIGIALPAIESDLGGGLAGQQWLTDAYLLALGSLLLIGGSLGDIFGQRRVFFIGVAGFGLTSMLCALPSSIALLCAFRAAQGVFAASTAEHARRHRPRLLARRARPGDRIMDGAELGRRRDRPTRRRSADRRLVVAADLRHQRPPRPDHAGADRPRGAAVGR